MTRDVIYWTYLTLIFDAGVADSPDSMCSFLLGVVDPEP